jgi:hypothetical protein
MIFLLLHDKLKKKEYNKKPQKSATKLILKFGSLALTKSISQEPNSLNTLPIFTIIFHYIFLYI